MVVRRIIDLIPYMKENHLNPDEIIAGKKNNEWYKVGIDEYEEKTNYFSAALIKMGVKKGDMIISIVNSSPEWNIMDMGIMQVGAIHIPVYPTISEDDFKYICKHSEAKSIILGTSSNYNRFKNAINELDFEEIIFVNPFEEFNNYDNLLKIGKENYNSQKIEKLKKAVKSEDIATLIYTSGTTGVPKGVMLTHSNLISNFTACAYIPYQKLDRVPGLKSLSFLPLSHVYERMMNYMFQYDGISIYYNQNLAKITDDLADIKPHIMTAVPRFLEKIYDKIIAKGKTLKNPSKKIFNNALKLADRYQLDEDLECGNRRRYKNELALYDKLVFSKWRKILGGNMSIIISGGAALSPKISRAFWTAKIKIMEGYGLSETSPVIAVSTFDRFGSDFGSVGPILKNVEAKIAADGEIITKGPHIMKGYYKAPELTNEVIDKDGWFHTGDIGTIDLNGLLRITGRKKAMFKTSMGKYVYPQLIESKIKLSPFIDDVIVVGENEKFAGAIIVPNFTHLRLWCKTKGIIYTTKENLVLDNNVKKQYHKEIQHCNKSLGKTEQILGFRLCDDEWTIENHLLTPSLKVKRNKVMEKYEGLIKEIYMKKWKHARKDPRPWVYTSRGPVRNVGLYSK